MLQDNAIIFEGFRVVLQPALYADMPNYLAEMAASMSEVTTPEQANSFLTQNNNDGSWCVVVDGSAHRVIGNEIVFPEGFVVVVDEDHHDENPNKVFSVVATCGDKMSAAQVLSALEADSVVSVESGVGLGHIGWFE